MGVLGSIFGISFLLVHGIQPVRPAAGTGMYIRPACHGCVGTLIFILSYLRARDPERILLYIDRGTFVF